MLPLSLAGRPAERGRPDPSRGLCWLAVLCPPGYVVAGAGGKNARLSVPQNCITTPHVDRMGVVRVRVQTPCCGRPLAGVALCIGGCRADETGLDGRAELQLPRGCHVLTSPGCPGAELRLDVDPDADARGGAGSDGGENEDEDAGQAPHDLHVGGELVLFLKDFRREGQRDGVFLGANRQAIEADDEAHPYSGSVCLPADAAGAAAGSGAAGPTVRSGAPCHDAVSQIMVRPADGREFELADKFVEWVDSLRGECLMAMLFSGEIPPPRLGVLLGEVRESQSQAPLGSLEGAAEEASVGAPLTAAAPAWEPAAPPCAPAAPAARP
ncbi:unnamed protein product, partial [Prorocentrum cordatum]